MNSFHDSYTSGLMSIISISERYLAGLYLKPGSLDRDEVLAIIDELHQKESTYELYQRMLKETGQSWKIGK